MNRVEPSCCARVFNSPAVEDQFLGRSTPAVNGGAGMIDRQVKDGLRAGQFIFPVCNLLCQRFAAQVFLLPLRIFGILQREFGKLGFFLVYERLIRTSQLAEQNRN